MKTKIILGLAFLLTLSCNKYEEGRWICLKSKKERVANTWQLEEYRINGVDVTAKYKAINYTEKYNKAGEFEISANNETRDGQWEFISEARCMRRFGMEGIPTRTLIITRLTEKEFWYYYMLETEDDQHERHEIHLKD